MTDPVMNAQPIVTAPHTGKVIFVADDTGTVAKVFWHKPAGKGRAGSWCYGHLDAPEQPWHVIDFEPTHWADDAKTLFDHFQQARAGA
jgi:hypothetical protein